MRHRSFTQVLLASALCGNSIAAELKPLPSGWEMIGIGAQSYSAGIDLGVFRNGKPAGYLRSKSDAARLPGVLSQILDARKYRGTRCRYSAALKYRGVRRQVGLWMWVLGPDDKVLTQDFMDDRIFKGNSDWKRAAIVLDIPPNADRIVYGVRLWGPGEAWVNGMKMEAVGQNIPVTDPSIKKFNLPSEPNNLF